MPAPKKPSRPKARGGEKSSGEDSAELRKLVHDLNNAVAPITLYAGVLKMIITDKKAVEMLDNIELCAKQVASISEKLRELGGKTGETSKGP